MITQMTEQRSAKDDMFHSAATLKQRVMKNVRLTLRIKCTSWLIEGRFSATPTSTVHQLLHQNGMGSLQSSHSPFRSHIAVNQNILGTLQDQLLPICATFAIVKISASMSLDETTRSTRDAMSSTPFQILPASRLICLYGHLWTWRNAANTSFTLLLTRTSSLTWYYPWKWVGGL